MSDACKHPEHEVGPCPVCGACAHELVLNGACYYCGATDLVIDHKKDAPSDFVPVESLRRRRDE
jgi:hypothetical protein